MIITAHVIAGGVLGEEINSPVLAFLAGIILHFILDMVPHFDNVLEKGKWTWKQAIFTTFDLILTIALLVYLKPELSFFNPFWWGALGGIFPDLLDNVPFWNKYFRASKIGESVHKFHDKIHHLILKDQPGVIIGLTTQIITLLFFLWLAGKI